MSPNETHYAGIEKPFITTLPERLREIIDGRGLLWWLTGGVRFDRALELLAYRRSTELDWASLVSASDIFLLYTWNIGDVSSVAERPHPPSGSMWRRSERAWVTAPADWVTLEGFLAGVVAADSGAGVEDEPEPEQVPPVQSEDESDDGYEDAADVNRFLGLDARSVEDGFFGRVSDVCRRHGVCAPTNIDTLVAGVDNWLVRQAESDSASESFRADLDGAAACERALANEVDSLKAAVERCAAESASRHTSLGVETRRLAELAQASEAV